MTRLLKDSQLDRLSEFTANLGLVFFASGVAPLFSPGIVPVNLIVVILGVALAFTCLIASLLLIKGIKL